MLPMKNWMIAVFVFCGSILTPLQDAGPKCSCKNHLVLTYNPETKIHWAINETASTVPVLDQTHNISSMYDGRTGAALAFNYETGVSYYIPPGSDVTWLTNKTSFNDYFDNLPSQLELYRYGESHGIRFDPTWITDDIADVMAQVLGTLSPEYGKRCEALATFLQISKVNGDFLKTSLTGFQDVMGKFDVPFRGDFKWVVGVYKGIGTFFEAIPGGMSTLVRNHISLDMGTILTRDSGIHLLIYFLEQLDKHFPVGQILGKTLNDPLEFFSIIDKFGGELDYGFDGYVHMVSEIVKFDSRQNSFATVENTLRAFASNPLTNSTENCQKWKSSIQDLSQAINRLKLNWPLKKLSEMLRDISDGRWTLHNVDMSRILQVLIKIDSSSDEVLITQVLNLLQSGE